MDNDDDMMMTLVVDYCKCHLLTSYATTVGDY